MFEVVGKQYAQRAGNAHGGTQTGSRFDARVWKPLSVPCIEATMSRRAKQGNDAIKGLANSTVVSPWIWLKQKSLIICVPLHCDAGFSFTPEGSKD